MTSTETKGAAANGDLESLHRAFAEILGVLLGIDAWHCGPSLADMDLAGAPAEVMQRALGR